MMTRFELELSGKLGKFWQESAERELEQVREDLNAGRITVGVDGVARNCIGRPLSDDMLEKLVMVAPEETMFYLKPTKKARQAEVEATLRSYRSREVSAEEMSEMRSAFGPGETVVDVLSGKEYHL